MRVAIVDNYDSFTHNIVQGLRVLGARVDVVKNDEISAADLARERHDGIVLSPGPCTPDEAGITLEVARVLSGKIPLLGICLGHQAIAQAFGARVVRAERPRHGKASAVVHDGRGSLAHLPSPFDAGRYHSLVVDPATLPAHVEPTARSADDGTLMAFYDAASEVEGLQFHPESVLTPRGQDILGAWLARVASIARTRARADRTGASAACS